MKLKFIYKFNVIYFKNSRIFKISAFCYKNILITLKMFLIFLLKSS